MSLYQKMKQKVKNEASEATYFNFLLDALCRMFKWGGLPFESRWFEIYLHCDRYFGTQKSDATPEGYVIVPEPALNGELNQFGIGTHAEGVTRGGGFQLNGEIGKDVAICYNNTARCMDFDILQYANYLAQIDKAIMINTKLSGLAPILCATNSKTEKQINDLLNFLLDGNVKAIQSEDVIKALQAGGGDGVYSVDITHPERIRNVQYQSQLWDNLLRRFFNKYGLNVQNTNKMAQVSQDEVNAWDGYSWILPVDMLEERQKFCTEANRIFGTNWSVDFAEPWKQEYEAYITRKTKEDTGKEDSMKEGEDNADSSDSDTERDVQDENVGDDNSVSVAIRG